MQITTSLFPENEKSFLENSKQCIQLSALNASVVAICDIACNLLFLSSPFTGLPYIAVSFLVNSVALICFSRITRFNSLPVLGVYCFTSSTITQIAYTHINPSYYIGVCSYFYNVFNDNIVWIMFGQMSQVMPDL